jgi:molybdopterin-guanine dinucleotide biosynthesis protein A
MIGVVLCGGESKRMGSDKALLFLKENTWSQLAYNKFLQLQIPVVLSVNKHQAENNTDVLPTSMCIIDNQELSIGGPLLGLLSAHKVYPTEAIFLLACDMPTMAIEVLEYLQRQTVIHPLFEAIVFENNGQPEPLCAIYSAKGLQKILALYFKNCLPKHSMKYALEQLNVTTIPLPLQWLPHFYNYNFKADLNRL